MKEVRQLEQMKRVTRRKAKIRMSKPNQKETHPQGALFVLVGTERQRERERV